ncbi:MAG TPA: hypothetical protein VE987_02650, partial [Polyangiaceae bacterium]|nr:hypothetical protein [Polyangiaceae bacterium]
MARAARLPLIALAALAALAPMDARASRRAHVQTADAWWAGLDQGATAVAAHGLRVLRAAPVGRVRIPGGTFVMGSTPAGMTRAIELCERE